MTGGSGPRRNGGYVLLVTLGLLVLSSTLLVAVGRSAVRHAADAHLEQQRLQRSWALASCRWAVRPYAEQLLVTAEQATGRPAPRLRADVTLGTMTVAVIVADEQAKAGANELLQRFPTDAVEARLTRTVSGTPLVDRVRVRPVDGRHVHGYDQLFDAPAPAELLAGSPAAPIDVVTCWGDGGLNVLRADPAAMRLSLSPSLSQLQIARLVTARQAALNGNRPTGPAAAAHDAVTGLLDAAGVVAKDRGRLPLVGRSTCHSALLILNDGRRLWYDLTVTDESPSTGPRVSSVVW